MHKKLSREVRLTCDKEVPPSTLRSQPTPDDGAANDAIKTRQRAPVALEFLSEGSYPDIASPFGHRIRSGYRFSLRSLIECFSQNTAHSTLRLVKSVVLERADIETKD